MQENQKSMLAWLNANRDLCVEALRIYLGVGIFLQGVLFLLDENRATSYMQHEDLPFLSYFAVHYIILAHIGGGLLLIAGLLTRLAAVAQIPILGGAIFFLNRELGLFTTQQTLEFASLVLFLMAFFTLYGGGRFSLDSWIAQKMHTRNKQFSK